MKPYTVKVGPHTYRYDPITQRCELLYSVPLEHGKDWHKVDGIWHYGTDLKHPPRKQGVRA